MDYLNDATELVTELLIATNSGTTENGTPIGLDHNAKLYFDMRLEQILDSLQQLAK